MLVGFIEGLRLSPALFIERTIYTAALHNAAGIKISLPVANDVNFFGVQFSANLARKNREINVNTTIS